ncbi:MAG TPA: response regulator [Candidatus Polarisedimenticolaceae bacterium]
MSKVLLVDGDRVWSSFCEAELRRDGHEVLIARDGSEALEEFASRTPDVVVTEIRLAGIDGLDLMARILDRSPRTPVILHTTHAAYRDNFMSWLADAYLLKSLDSAPLRTKVRELLIARGIGISNPSPASH